MFVLDSPTGSFPNDSDWHDTFWRGVEGLGECDLTHQTQFADSGSEDEFVRVLETYSSMTKAELGARIEALKFDLKHPETSAVIGSLLARQVTLANDFAFSMAIWTPHCAPIFLRVMADVFITLAWILKSPDERSAKFVYDGIGRVKLEIAQRKSQLENDPENLNGEDQKALIEFQQSWVDSQIYDQLLEVNLGSWSGISTRKMAEESGHLDFYNWVYQPFSAAVHSHWSHLSWHNSAHCENPAHRFYSVGVINDYEPSAYWLELSARYLRKTFGLFDEWNGIGEVPESAYDFLSKNFSPVSDSEGP